MHTHDKHDPNFPDRLRLNLSVLPALRHERDEIHSALAGLLRQCRLRAYIDGRGAGCPPMRRGSC